MVTDQAVASLAAGAVGIGALVVAAPSPPGHPPVARPGGRCRCAAWRPGRALALASARKASRPSAHGSDRLTGFAVPGMVSEVRRPERSLRADGGLNAFPHLKSFGAGQRAAYHRPRLAQGGLSTQEGLNPHGLSSVALSAELTSFRLPSYPNHWGEGDVAFALPCKDLCPAFPPLCCLRRCGKCGTPVARLPSCGACWRQGTTPSCALGFWLRAGHSDHADSPDRRLAS